jgi:hypothetical protein
MLITGLPGMHQRAQEYAALYGSRRIRVDEEAISQGIQNALVIVPSSWADELHTRMRARGVHRSDVERVLSQVGPDYCLLQRRLFDLEVADVKGERALGTLLAPRATPSQGLPEHCVLRLVEERQGSWSLHPFLIARRNGNLYARDLHERNELLLERHPDRPVYVARPHPQHGLRRPVFVPFDADSARSVWFLRLPI